MLSIFVGSSLASIKATQQQPQQHHHQKGPDQTSLCFPTFSADGTKSDCVVMLMMLLLLLLLLLLLSLSGQEASRRRRGPPFSVGRHSDLASASFLFPCATWSGESTSTTEESGAVTAVHRLQVALTRRDLSARWQCRVASPALNQPLVAQLSVDVHGTLDFVSPFLPIWPFGL